MFLEGELQISSNGIREWGWFLGDQSDSPSELNNIGISVGNILALEEYRALHSAMGNEIGETGQTL